MAKNEDRNVSSLLETKSQRAPRTESPSQRAESFKTDTAALRWTKAGLVAALGSLILAILRRRRSGRNLPPAL